MYWKLDENGNKFYCHQFKGFNVCFNKKEDLEKFLDDLSKK